MTDDITRHTPLEDLQALLIGTLLVSLGVAMFKHAGLLSGGTAGIGFLLHYVQGWPFGATFFVINLPFYVVAWRFLGAAFTVRTMLAVTLVSALSDWLPAEIAFARLEPWFAAVLGGVLMGNGFLILFRHRMSLGGLGIVALALQQHRGWRAGHVQMAIDALVVCAAAVTVTWDRWLSSVLAIVVLNLVIATNHRPGRYVAQ